MKHTTEGLLGYFPPINALFNHKITIHRAMRKPRDLTFKRFATLLTELNNHLTQLPGSSNAKKIPPKDLNKILVHTILNVWAKKYYLQGWEL